MHTIYTHELSDLRRDYDIFVDSPPPDEELLLRGLIPPLPVRGETLVWGFPLVRAAGRLAVGELAVREVEGDDIELLILALRMEGRKNFFTLREKAGILSFLRKRNAASRAQDVSRCVQSEGSFIKQAARYLSMPDNLRRLVDRGYIDLKTADMSTGFSGKTLELLERIFETCSFSQRRRAFRNFYEVGIRDSLSEEQMNDLVCRLDDEEDPLTALEVLRYPNMTDMKKRFDVVSSGILKGSGISLTEPAGFEGDGFSVSFRFTGKKQLEKVIARLEVLANESDELFSLLR